MNRDLYEYDQMCGVDVDAMPEIDTPTSHRRVLDALNRPQTPEQVKSEKDAAHRALMRLLSADDREEECLSIISDARDAMVMRYRVAIMAWAVDRGAALTAGDYDRAEQAADAVIHYWTTSEDRDACPLGQRFAIFDAVESRIFGDVEHIAERIERYTRTVEAEIRATGCGLVAMMEVA